MDLLLSNLADVVHGVRQLEGAGALRCAQDVTPLVTNVTDDGETGILQLLPLAGLVCNGGPLELASGVHCWLEQQLHPPGVSLPAEVRDGYVPLVLGAARQEHRLDAELEQPPVQPPRLRQRRRAPLCHILTKARVVVRRSSAKGLVKIIIIN